MPPAPGWKPKPRHRPRPKRPEYEEKKAAYDAKKGRRGRPPKPPDETPPPDRQINLTDPDSQLMRKSKAHEYRQAYNAQAVVCAEGSQLILATNMATTPSDQPTFAASTHLSLGQHRHCFDAGQRPLCRPEALKAEHGPGQALDPAVVLLDPVIEPASTPVPGEAPQLAQRLHPSNNITPT